MNKLKFYFLMIACNFACIYAFSQVGINTTSPLSTLDINGNLSVKVINLNGSGTPTTINDGVYISINPEAQDQEFKLPNPTLVPGRIYFIRNINNTFTAKLTTVSGLLVPQNTTTGTSQIYMYDNNSRTITVISDGTNWTYIY